jgi:hypothetical protein
MEQTQQPVNTPYLSLYFGIGSIATLVLEVLVLAYGLSDGSLSFVIFALVSPLLAVASIIVGSIAFKQKQRPSAAAIVGIVCGGVSLVLMVGLIVFIYWLVSGLQGIY